MVSLTKKIKKYATGHDIHTVHCNGHAIQLTLNEVTEKKKHHRQFILIQNRVFVFYGDHKKKASLTKTSKDMGAHPVYPRKVNN